MNDDAIALRSSTKKAALGSSSALAMALALAGIGLVAGCASTDADVKTASQWQQMCSACHGPDGSSRSARSPLLAGQQAVYLGEQLRAFRSHARADAGARAFMWPMAAGLSDAMIDNLSTHFATLPPPGHAAAGTDAAAATGQALYTQGACSSCHGDKGQGIAPFPRLAGQHADYTQSQLAAYADDSRPHAVMGPMAKSLTGVQAKEIAAYLATQR